MRAGGREKMNIGEWREAGRKQKPPADI